MKYDEFELLELFYDEGQSLFDNVGDGNIGYKRTIGDFSVTIFIFTYEQRLNIYLEFKEHSIFSSHLNNITELKKQDNYLKIFTDSEEVANIFFGEFINITVGVD